MIYFSPTVRALESHIAELQQRLSESETERKALLDRLLAKHRIETIAEAPKTPVAMNSRVIAPPWVGFSEMQDAQRDVWVKEEMDYLMREHGWDYSRAKAEAEARYTDQNAVSLV